MFEMVFYLGIDHVTGTFPLFCALDFCHITAVTVEEFGQLIAVHPDLVISFFLGFVENKLKSPVQMYRLDIIDIFFRAVTGVSHIADHVPRRDHAAFLKSFRIRVILAQVGIIIVSAAVEAADADAPAAVLVPAERLHDAGFDGDNRRANRNEKLYVYKLKAYISYRHAG